MSVPFGRLVVVLAVCVGHVFVAPVSGQSTFVEATADVEGTTLFYRIGGSGPALLMLHGMTGVGADWDLYIERLAESYTVIVPDLPGHGRSTNDSGVFEFPGVAIALFGLADHLGLRQFAAVGYSVGGATLLHMAREAPERIAAMVLVAGGHYVSAERRQGLRESPAFEDRSAEDREWFLTHHPGGEAQVRLLLAQRRALADNYIDLNDDDLAGIPVPTLLVWGENDVSFPLPIPFELQQALPTAELWIVQGQGHFLLWPEYGGSERVVSLLPRAIEAFLREHGYPN